MNQYRYKVKHLGCGHTEIVACWLDKNGNDDDARIKQFAHKCHIIPLGQREVHIPACEAALTEEKPEYEIIKRRF